MTAATPILTSTPGSGHLCRVTVLLELPGVKKAACVPFVVASSQSVSPMVVMFPPRTPFLKVSGVTPVAAGSHVLGTPLSLALTALNATPIQLSSTCPRARTPSTMYTFTTSKSGVHIRVSKAVPVFPYSAHLLSVAMGM